jgi:hypothetical protein
MSSELSFEDIDAAALAVRAFADDGDDEGAWTAAAPLWWNLPRGGYGALALLRLVDRRSFSRERSLEILRRAFDLHAFDASLLGALGEALESAHDVRFLNGPAPSDPLFESVARRLQEALGAVRGGESESETLLLTGLATAARLVGRTWDAVAERAYVRLIELRPERWQDHYNLGLFFKVRGRFAEGVIANQRASAVGGDQDESVRWNLGISATGARQGSLALSVWKELGQRIELGRFGLPDGSYEQVKVRLAQHPIATRAAEQTEPGLEETVWVERLSPCHGIVRSALFQELGVDFGDLVLFDGAPIMHQTYGEQEVPVFPQLATIERPGYRIFSFAGTQPVRGSVDALNEGLPEDVLVYPHTEKVTTLCAHCWASESRDHAAHRQDDHAVVRGKVCAPPTLALAELRRALDEAVARSPGVRLFVPMLSQLLGDHARAEVERRRIAMIDGTSPDG